MSSSSNASLSASNTTCGGNSSSNETERKEQEGPAVTVLSSSLIVLLAFICLLIIAVNGLVIYLMYRKKTLRSLTNMFLTSLAFSDLISGSVGFPLVVHCQAKEIISVCVSSTIFVRFTAISSVCHVLLVACDRYIAIVHPLQRGSLVTKWRATGATVFVWLFSSAASLIQLSWYSLNESALTSFDETYQYFNLKYTTACIVLFFVIPLLVMCYIYGCIFHISLKSMKSDRKLTSALQQPQRSFLHEWRGRSVLLIMVVIFAGCWLPFFLAMLSDHELTSDLSASTSVWVERLLAVLTFIPPLLNPLLCTLAKKDFRRAVKEVVFRQQAAQQFEKRAYFHRGATSV